MRGRLALLFVHLIGNALLLWLGYYWLGLDESDAKHLLYSAFVALFVLVRRHRFARFDVAVLFRAGPPSSRLRKSVQHLLPLVVLSLAALAIYGVLLWVSGTFGKIGYVIGSSLTMLLRKPVPPETVQRVLEWLLWLIKWAAVPAVLLPMAASVSLDGWRGWRFHRLSKRWLYWLEVAVLLVCALWVPFKLFFWVPKIASFGGQMVSFTARACAGYLLFVAAALVLDFITSSGKPRATQPSTVVSP